MTIRSRLVWRATRKRAEGDEVLYAKERLSKNAENLAASLMHERTERARERAEHARELAEALACGERACSTREEAIAQAQDDARAARAALAFHAGGSTMMPPSEAAAAAAQSRRHEPNGNRRQHHAAGASSSDVSRQIEAAAAAAGRRQTTILSGGSAFPTRSSRGGSGGSGEGMYSRGGGVYSGEGHPGACDGSPPPVIVPEGHTAETPSLTPADTAHSARHYYVAVAAHEAASRAAYIESKAQTPACSHHPTCTASSIKSKAQNQGAQTPVMTRGASSKGGRRHGNPLVAACEARAAGPRKTATVHPCNTAHTIFTLHSHGRAHDAPVARAASAGRAFHVDIAH